MGKIEDISDRTVTIFLIIAILISIISIWTVVFSLEDTSPSAKILPQQQSSGNGVISLVILERDEQTDGTK